MQNWRGLIFLCIILFSRQCDMFARIFLLLVIIRNTGWEDHCLAVSNRIPNSCCSPRFRRAFANWLSKKCYVVSPLRRLCLLLPAKILFRSAARRWAAAWQICRARMSTAARSCGLGRTYVLTSSRLSILLETKGSLPRDTIRRRTLPRRRLSHKSRRLCLYCICALLYQEQTISDMVLTLSRV